MTIRWRIAASFALLIAASAAHGGTWKCDSRNPTAHVLYFEGEIKSRQESRNGDEGERARFTREYGSCFGSGYQGQRTVNLNSGGGSVDQALGIASDLVNHGQGSRPVAVEVGRGGVCISACTYLFVAGRLRNVAGGGSFEPHGFSVYRGSRLDDAIVESIDKATGKIDPEKLDLQFARLRLLAPWLQAFARGDARFSWADEWLAGFHDPEGVRTRDVVGAAQAVVQMTEAQKRFVISLDAVLASAMPELERVAALQAFAPLVAQANARAVPPPAFDVDYYRNWIVREFGVEAQTYVRAQKDSRKPVMNEAFLEAVTASLRTRMQSVVKTVQQDLGPYLMSRANEIDVGGFVQLMFSTSILYTRPITREEMCDLNIVNRDCAN